MNTAMTAAEEAVEAPKMRRSSRNQATWYTSAHIPEQKSSAATRETRKLTGGILQAFASQTKTKRLGDRWRRGVFFT